MFNKKAGILPVMLLLAVFPVFAQNVLFKPFTSLRVIRTEHFEIIFPRESEASARLLASYADDVYERVSSLLGIGNRGRIPVTFTPHTEMFNGYYNPAFNHIVLYDTPMDIEWTSFANNLEGLFIHELTHAVTLNSRSPFLDVVQRIFGNWANLTFITAPDFMKEGATISIESLDGHGRANDPRTKQYLRQAIHEDKFLTPFQASGVYDRPNQPSGYWYQYGGLFSAWLQETYGMEKYAELWKTMGRKYYVSVAVYRSDFYRIFRNTYRVHFLDAWKAFRLSLAPDTLETNTDELLPHKYRYHREREQFLGTVAARGDTLYYLDKTESKVGIIHTLTGKRRTLDTDSLAYDIDVSADGGALLLSSYRYLENRAMAIVTEYKAHNGIRTGRAIDGLYKARYFREGVIGIRSDLHNTCIAYEDFNGNSEILLRGNEELMFSGPQALDSERFVFITSRKGVRELWLYNYVSRELFQIESAGDDNGYWRYMRDLGVSDGKIFFIHNADDQMYKLGMVDPETMEAVFNDRNFSGGVFSPVSINNTVYYRGAFVQRDSLLRFSEPAGSISGSRTGLRLMGLDALYERFDRFDRADPIAPDNETPDTNQSYATLDIPLAETAPEQSQGGLLYEKPSKAYVGIKYMNPFKFWLPMFLIRTQLNQEDPEAFPIRLDGGGIFSIMADPTDRNLIYFLAYADFYYKMAVVEEFYWQNTYLGFPLILSFSDTVTELEYSFYPFRRTTNIGLLASLAWNMGQLNSVVSLGSNYYRRAAYKDEIGTYNNEKNNGKSAYEWEKTNSGFAVQADLALSYRELKLKIEGISLTDTFTPRINGLFQINTNTRLPMQYTLFGAYDMQGMDVNGNSFTFITDLLSDYMLNEFNHPTGLRLDWLGGIEAAINIFSFEIQKNLLHLYFNRIFGTLLLRNQIYDSKGNPMAEGIALDNLRLIQSMAFRLNVTVSFLPVVKVPFSFNLFIMGAWKYSNLISGNEGRWFLDFGINAAY